MITEQQRLVDFNCNYDVLIRLTEHGKDMLRKKYEEAKIPFKNPEENDDGWSKWKLWEVMENFGSQCHLGFVNQPFLPGIKLVYENDSEVEQQQEPLEIAEKWYTTDELHDSILKTGAVPKDTRSREFAEWLAHQYRLAMAKGIQIFRDQADECKAELQSAVSQKNQEIKTLNTICTRVSEANERLEVTVSKKDEEVEKKDEEIKALRKSIQRTEHRLHNYIRWFENTFEHNEELRKELGKPQR